MTEKELAAKIMKITRVTPDGEIISQRTIELDARPAVVYDADSWTEQMAFDEFCAAIRQPNGDRYRAARSAFDRLQCWQALWERLSRLPNVDDNFRQNFHSRLVESGWDFEDRVSDPAPMIRAFRHLLPAYSGSSQQLYRGELASKHNQRKYGFFWTSSLDVARRFAGRKTFFNDLGIIVGTFAPSEAIISAPNSHTEWLQEFEFIVDPSALPNVCVID